MTKTILLTQASALAPEKRLNDVVESLIDNMGNALIDEVHIFASDPAEAFMEAVASPKTPATAKLRAVLNGPKVRINHHGGDPNFSAYFRHASAQPSGSTIIIASQDVAFDGTLASLLSLNLNPYFVCLSRDMGKASPAAGVSQDAWIFRLPLKKFDADWPIGTLGGDNKLACLAWKAGYVVINPAFSINARCRNTAHHNRWGGCRLDGPYLDVHPIGLESVRGGA